MNARCIEGPRLLPVGTVSALELAQHWGREWHAWWAYARHAFAMLPEDVDDRAAYEPIGECTADEVIGESIALEHDR